jgi:hypothetical protein
MRRIILLALIALTATAGTAAADRDNRRGDRHGYRDNRGGNRHTVRDHRRDNYRRDYRPTYRRDHRRYDHRPVYHNNGRYVFRNGRSFNYRRPVINYRYTNYRVRPQIIVENYDTVPGYIWVRGNWSWNGYEWIWNPGHYVIDSNYAGDDAYYYSY